MPHITPQAYPLCAIRMTGHDMTQHISRLTAGLVFSGPRQIDMTRSARHAAALLDSLGHAPSGLRILPDGTAQITTSQHVLRLRIRPEAAPMGANSQAGTCLELCLISPGPMPARDPSALSADMMVTYVLKALHGLLQADHIRWVGDPRLLSRDDFDLITATLPPIAATVPRRAPLPVAGLAPPPAPTTASQSNLQEVRDFLRNIDADDSALRPRQATRRPISAPQRLSAWLMTYALILLALPVGLALLLLTVVKGENPRLTSQAAALTGPFLAFQTFGTTAQAMSAVQALLF